MSHLKKKLQKQANDDLEVYNQVRQDTLSLLSQIESYKNKFDTLYLQKLNNASKITNINNPKDYNFISEILEDIEDKLRQINDEI